MQRTKIFLLVIGLLITTASISLAQFPVINAEDVKSWVAGKRKIMIVDARPSEEYQAGHIPGSVNIPAEKIKSEAGRLPKDKSVPIIFYCRGAG